MKRSPIPLLLMAALAAPQVLEPSTPTWLRALGGVVVVVCAAAAAIIWLGRGDP